MTRAASADLAHAGLRGVRLPQLAPLVLRSRPERPDRARQRGTITGTLLLDGPGANTGFGPMLGPAAGTIGYVGVAPAVQGRGIGTALRPQLPHWLDQP